MKEKRIHIYKAKILSDPSHYPKKNSLLSHSISCSKNLLFFRQNGKFTMMHIFSASETVQNRHVFCFIFLIFVSAY
ncbi:hypothetical protein A2I97_08850 [Bacillus velezensis]|nr:hypothetical protein A2I97_08850 [Bacillus velezensis]